jgi:hypothetical protein
MLLGAFLRSLLIVDSDTQLPVEIVGFSSHDVLLWQGCLVPTFITDATELGSIST